MLTAIIIDDEKKGRIALREKLKNYCPEIQLTGEAEDGNEGLIVIKEVNPDIVFLDIEMPRLDGFEMLQKLPDKNFHLIFITAYNHYAIRAIKYAAFDYLLKPVDIEELKSTIKRIEAQTNRRTARQLEILQHNLSDHPMLNKIAISAADGLLFFNIADIIHLEAQSNYTAIHFSNRPVLLASRTLKDFEELLPPELFFRSHHSRIVNLRYIKRYIRGDGGQIEMLNGDHVPVSRRKKENFLKIFKDGVVSS